MTNFDFKSRNKSKPLKERWCCVGAEGQGAGLTKLDVSQVRINLLLLPTVQQASLVAVKGVLASPELSELSRRCRA